MFWIETCKLEKSKKKNISLRQQQWQQWQHERNSWTANFFLWSSESQYLFLVPTETRVEQKLLALN